MEASQRTCGETWPTYLVAVYGTSDVIMLVGYAIVAYLFFSYLKPRHVQSLKTIFVLLGWVFVLCGLTHGVRIVGFFVFMPAVVAGVNLFSSVVTVALLVRIIPLVPTIMKFPTASAMGKANNDLRHEISELLESNAKLSTVDNLKAVENITCAIRAIRELSVVSSAGSKQ